MRSSLFIIGAFYHNKGEDLTHYGSTVFEAREASPLNIISYGKYSTSKVVKYIILQKPNWDIIFLPALSDPLVMCDVNFAHGQNDVIKALTINLTINQL